MIFTLFLVFMHATPVPPPAWADHPYAGRLRVIVEDDVREDARCQHAWDVRPGGFADACTWPLPDGGCGMLLPRLSAHASVAEQDWYVGVIRQETAECNGWRPPYGGI